MRRQKIDIFLDIDGETALQKIKNAVIDDNVLSMIKKESFLKKTRFKAIVNEKKMKFQITLRPTKGDFFFTALKGKVIETNRDKCRIIAKIGCPIETMVIYLVAFFIVGFLIYRIIVDKFLSYKIFKVLFALFVVLNIIFLPRMLFKKEEKELNDFLFELFRYGDK